MLPFLDKNVHIAQAKDLRSSLSPFTHLGGDSIGCHLELEWVLDLKFGKWNAFPLLDALAFSSITCVPKPPKIGRQSSQNGMLAVQTQQAVFQIPPSLYSDPTAAPCMEIL